MSAISLIRALQRRLIFLLDGVSPHVYGAVKEILEQSFRNILIGRVGPLDWPPYSPDLNPCDFYLWGHTESIFYQVSITCIEHLENRIGETIQSINENMVMRIWDNIKTY